MTDADDPVVVYRTSHLNEADVVADAMERARIPYFRRIETLGGLSVAMSANPPPGLMPGDFWAIAVPGTWAKRAARFIARSPVSREFPETHRMPGIEAVFEGWTWLFVLAILGALIWTIIRMYRG